MRLLPARDILLDTVRFTQCAVCRFAPFFFSLVAMKRRTFLKAGSALSLATAFTPFTAFADTPPRVGLIGTGWYGKTDLLRLIQVAPVEVVALCDVDARMLADAAQQVAARQRSGQTPQTYRDYREMLAAHDLDIVLIATPDHWHALPMIAAVQSGADVYVQKPIGVDVVEGQAMLAAARKYDRVVQVGLQRRSTPHLVEAKEQVIEAGLLGEISHVELCCYYAMRNTSNPPDISPPAHLDWDMYTGPAPMRPYNEIVHPRGWRNFMEYSNGIVGDMCVHMFDMARWMLGLGWPSRISSQGGVFVQTDAKANTTDTQTATFDFDDLTMTWQHRTWGHAPDPDYPWAAIFYGNNGTLKTSVMSYDYIPHGDGERIHRDVTYELEEYPEDKTEDDLERHVAPAIRYHMLDFLDAIDQRRRPISDIEEGYISSSSCILANLALKLGRTIHWDADAERVVDDDEANDLLARPYRAPWVHPTPANV